MKTARSLTRILGAALLFCGAALAQGTEEKKTFWLPERATSDALPVRIDELFNMILWITGTTMVIVFLLMAFFLVKYRGVPGRKRKFVHGNHTLEIVWTVIPAGILIWLGFTQVPDWSLAKVPKNFPKAEASTIVQVAAQQFDWNFRQPGLDGKFETYDLPKARAALDEAIKEGHEALGEFNPVASKYFTTDDQDDVVSKTLVVPVNKPVLIELRSIDVIHSFFIPVYRIKQDAVPGKPMPVWFRPTKIGEWEIACAELCGNNHTTMRATIKVLPQAAFDAWLKTESEKKQGTIDRAENSEDMWKHWFKQGVRPTVGGELIKPWNDVKIARQQAMIKPHSETPPTERR
jgi:cytochrome c oxidase subunit 2